MLKIAAIFLLSFAQAIAAQTIVGRVVGVHDGDTITVLDGGKRQHRIRLAQIDAPERRQAFGERSRQSLADLVFGKEVEVEVLAIDRYGRKVGKVRAGGMDVNLEQVRRGMAWVYRKYASDPAYFAIEAEARKAKRGLWAQPNPVPPWEFRHGQTKKGPSQGLGEVPPEKRFRKDNRYSGNKRSCKEMSSCSEAMYYLRELGLRSLDRDGDGIPCENLCR